MCVKERYRQMNRQAATSRNSWFELLRILSMLFILWAHLGLLPGYGQTQGAWPCQLLQYLRGVGDDLFFGLTAWFLCEKASSFHTSCRRVWQMEKQLLFYSLGMFAICSAVWLLGVYPMLHSWFDWAHLAVASVAPVLTGLWWYPTAYVIFILMHPWIDRGLHAIGRTGHGVLSVVGLIFWGVLPFFTNGMGLSAFMFLYMYVPMSYLRWYLPQVERSRTVAWQVFGIGVAMVLASCVLNGMTGGQWSYGAQAWSAPSMLTALGAILLCGQARPFHSRVVNVIAASTLPVYLIHMYWPVTIWLQATLLRAEADLLDSPWALFGTHFALLLAVYAAIVVIDLLRKALFAVTVDRPSHNGNGFERAWDRMVKWAPGLSESEAQTADHT